MSAGLTSLVVALASITGDFAYSPATITVSVEDGVVQEIKTDYHKFTPVGVKYLDKKTGVVVVLKYGDVMVVPDENLQTKK